MKKIVDPSCPTGWDERNLVRNAEYFTYHEVCCGDNCNFALKRNTPENTIDLKTEAANQTKCANAGLCPKVYYSSETEFIMDKLDPPVIRLFRQYRDPVVNELIVKSLFDLLDQLHQIGLVHGDLNSSNIMVKDGNPELEEDPTMSELERYLGHDYRYYFVDLSDQEPPQNASPLDKIFLDDWVRLFDSLPVEPRPYLRPMISEKINQLVNPALTDPDTGVTNFMIMLVNSVVSQNFLPYLFRSISPEVINLQDHEGNTVFHHLAADQHRYRDALYEMLIEAGGDPKIKNHDGFLPVDYEIDEYNKELLEAL